MNTNIELLSYLVSDSVDREEHVNQRELMAVGSVLETQSRRTNLLSRQVQHPGWFTTMYNITAKSDFCRYLFFLKLP